MRASGLHLCLVPITGILLGCAQGRGRLPNTRALGKPIRSGCCAAAELASSVPLRPHLSCRQILRARFPGVVAIDHTEFDRRARAGWAAFLHREAQGCTGQPPPPWWASASGGSWNGHAGRRCQARWLRPRPRHRSGCCGARLAGAGISAGFCVLLAFGKADLKHLIVGFMVLQ